MKATLKGRQIGLLFAEGSDGDQIEQLRSQIQREGGAVFLVAPKLHGTSLADGKILKADGQLSGSPSVLFDAIAIVLTEPATRELMNNMAAVQFVADAFAHLKAIGHSKAAGPLLEKSNVVADDGVTSLGSEFLAAASRRFWEREPSGV
jgi:catalase